MQSAILYVRVSTDEQAAKGYSQRNQIDRLKRYCIAREIGINEIILEDHSARTFDRPAWSKMFGELRRNRGSRPDLILFTRWDRFSRNVGDAYYMITQLHRIAITPQASDQELDLRIPESKIMLAIYITTAEVENDRRSINVREGMRKAKEEGRWTGPALKGYRNSINSYNRKCIIPFLLEASIISSAFREVAYGTKSISLIHRAALKAGLICSRSNFFRILRNPVYCGKILIFRNNGKEKYLVEGQHNGIVSEKIFKLVQRRFGRKENTPVAKKTDSQYLPLRGFIKCPICGNVLTGSASKGRTRHYYYYHCRNGCRFRVPAELANNYFSSELKKLRPVPFYRGLLRTILLTIDRELRGDAESAKEKITKSLMKIFERANNAKDLLVSGKIDSEDYQAIKYDCEHKINISGKILNNPTLHLERTDRILAKALDRFGSVLSWYSRADISEKREIIALLVGDGTIFDGKIFHSLLNKCTACLFKMTSLDIEDPKIRVREGALKIDAFEDYVVDYEASIGNVISLSMAKEIVVFLERFGKMALK